MISKKLIEIITLLTLISIFTAYLFSFKDPQKNIPKDYESDFYVKHNIPQEIQPGLNIFASAFFGKKPKIFFVNNKGKIIKHLSSKDGLKRKIEHIEISQRGVFY